VRGSRALVSCRQVALGFDLGHGQRLRAETSTFLRGHQSSQSGWKKSSLSPPAGCRAELRIEARSPG